MYLMREAGIGAWIQLVWLVGGGLWALVAAVLLAMKWKVPPVVAAMPLFMHAFTVIVGVTLAGWASGSALTADPSMGATLYAHQISGTLANGMFGVTVVPAAFLLGVGGLAAGVRGTRRWGAPVLAFLAVSVVAVLPLVSMAYDASLPSALVRCLLYGVCAIPLALALTGAHPNSNAREGGVVAAAAFISLVGSVELATIASAWSEGFSAIAFVDPGTRQEVVEALAAQIGDQATLAWIALMVATVPGLLAVFRSPVDLTGEELLNADVNPSPWRWLASASALTVVGVWAAALVWTNPAELLLSLTK